MSVAVRHPLPSRPAAPRTRVGAAAQAEYGLRYRRSKGVDDFVRQVSAATPLQLVDIERSGVAGEFLKDLSARLGIPAARLFTMLGVPKATAAKKAAAGEMLGGSAGQSAVGLARLLGLARTLAADSTAAQAAGFDSAHWLGQWLDRPQPSLGGRKPGDLIDTPTGLNAVSRLLGSIASGSYQ